MQVNVENCHLYLTDDITCPVQQKKLLSGQISDDKISGNMFQTDKPSDKGVYGAPFVGQETLSLPKPDVQLSCQRQSATLTHTHTKYETSVIKVG